MADQSFDNISTDVISTSVTVTHPPRRCWLTVEPSLLLFTVAIALSNSVLTQLFLVRSCEVTLGYASDKCNLLVNETESEEAHDIEDLVQPHVTILQMYKSVIEACANFVLCLFVGAWSDTHGRKPLMMWPIFGYGLHFAVLAMLSSVNYLPPTYLLLASIPVACSGGFITVVNGVYSYISDVTSTEKRAFRMGLLDCSMFGGFAIGMICSAPIFYILGKYGYLTIFSISCMLNLLGFLYLIFLPESVNINQTEESHGGLCSIFDFKLVIRMISTCCKKREHCRRPIVFLSVISISTCILIMEGEAAVVFLYARTKFGWNLSRYMEYATFAVLISIIGATAGMYIFSLKLKISDSVLVVGVFITKAAQSFLFAFASTPVYLIIGCFVGALGGVTGTLCRSVLSKSVPQDDIGAVFALTSMVEAVAPLAASPLYNLVYSATLTTFPGTLFLMSAGLYILGAILMGIVVMLLRVFPSQHSLLVNEDS